MTKDNHKRGKKVRTRLQQAAANAASELRFPGARRHETLFRIKNHSNVAEMLILLESSVRNRNIFDSFHGNPFPQEIDGLFNASAYSGPASLHSELMWGLYRASLYHIELSAFVVLKNRFESSVLLNEQENAHVILSVIEKQFGVSLWLLQNQLALAQVWSGLEEKRSLASNFIDQASNNNVIQLIINFIAKRSEATGLKNYLQEELDRFLAEAKDTILEAYIKTKLFDLGQAITPNMATTLFFDAQCSLIDHYETLILLLQSVSVDPDVPPDVVSSLVRFLSSKNDLKDSRLYSIKRTLDCEYQIEGNDIDVDRAKIIESYTLGRYAEVFDLSASYLAIHPRDISVCTLHSKSALALEISPHPLPGIVGELSILFCKLFAFGKETYGAAFAVFTMHDRFYGHAWAVMARAIVNDALSKQIVEYPSFSYNYVLAIDPSASPFTALSLCDKAKRPFRDSDFVRNAYPHTSRVLDALLDGYSGGDIGNIRLEKYVARNNLISKNYLIAASQYSSLMREGGRRERSQAAALATHAYLLLNDIPNAVQSVVYGALLNENVPIILPISDVVARLEDADSWPPSIELPIVFALYDSYFGDDKSSHLRYAFERFQMTNDISDPEDLVKHLDKFGRDKVITYLNRVWRPEVMRQTLLYENPKETEDARIAVCRALASIDSANVNRYQEEIRDRVKRQEIAKGTTLLEQSKVYVDIGAIKKALNTRLGDTYTRYKNATQANTNQQDVIMEELADMVSDSMSNGASSLTNMLSTVHVVDYKESELDLQFSALFSEVTNEFLKGDHGLNAYLSTRVRHGTLANTLRKPLADEHLVTALKEDETGYLPNSTWDSELSELSGADRALVLKSLDNFTRTFDQIVDHVKDNLIQIKVVHNLTQSGENSDALFYYQSSNLERKFIQEFDKKISNIEQLIDRCIESLWEKTDLNLANVRATLRNKVRPDFLNCFEVLVSQISSVTDFHAVNGLLNAIARAKTDFQTKLHAVESWFNRSEVYDRQDYSPDYAVQIALNMVQKTIPNGNHKLVVDIQMDSDGLMPGRSLDGMVDVFAGLFDNAVIRSGLPTDLLRVRVNISLQSGYFSAKIANNIADDRPSLSDEEKIKKVHDSLNKSDSRARAQREGGSGLLKVWRAITSPIYKDPNFSFAFTSLGEFNVEITYKFEQADDEDTAD